MILFYSDPHLGLKRKAHTTPTSSANREQHVRTLLNNLLDDQRYCARYCLGDLFDRECNSEEVILEGLRVTAKTTAVLAGNHDVPNRVDTVYSLSILQAIYPDRVVSGTARTIDLGQGSWLCLVPHMLVQADFEQYLRALIPAFQSWKDQGLVQRILLGLHCSFDLGFDTGETSLNLPRGLSEELLTTTDTILLGHDHVPADHFGGRLKIIGSLFPTAFSEIDMDHRALAYDPGTGQFTDLPIPVSAFTGLASGCPTDQAHQFYDLDDDLEPGKAAKLAVALFAAGAFGVRVRPRKLEQSAVDANTSRELRSLPARIAHDLQNDPELLALWNEFTA